MLLGRTRLRRGRDDPLQIDIVGGRRGGVELLVRLGHPQLTDAVTHGMVDDRPDGRASTLEPVDHDEAPQRPGAVERLLVQLGSEIEQLPFAAGWRELHVAYVEFDVELGIRHPRRRGDTGQARSDSFVETWQPAHGVAHREPEVIPVERTLEDRDGGPARIQPRIRLDVPHERFVVGHPFGHPVGEAGLPFARGHLSSSSRIAVRCRCQRCRCRCRCRCPAGDPARPAGRLGSPEDTSAPARRVSVCGSRATRVATAPRSPP